MSAGVSIGLVTAGLVLQACATGARYGAQRISPDAQLIAIVELSVPPRWVSDDHEVTVTVLRRHASPRKVLLEERFVIRGELFDVSVNWQSDDRFSIEYRVIENVETPLRRETFFDLVEYERVPESTDAFRRKPR